MSWSEALQADDHSDQTRPANASAAAAEATAVRALVASENTLTLRHA